MLELQVHGSPVVAREIVRALLACGARLAEPGEFTRRAFFNGKIDLQGAAAVADVIDAETRSAARAALANLGGGLATAVRAVRGSLTEILQEIAAAIDFPDEVPEPQRTAVQDRLSPLLASLVQLRRDGEVGRLVREGVAVAIVGPPNAGKSSLLNALARSNAYVADQPFATLDPTIRRVYLKPGTYVRLADTVGFITELPKDLINAFRATLEELREADLFLHVIDVSRPDWQRQRRAVDAILHELELARTPVLLVFNKTDLVARELPHEAGALFVSAVTGAGLASLRAAVIERVT
jgi:tRNA modification GTPase